MDQIVSKPTREAITFAFVANAFERRNDAMHGLVPLFAAAIGAHEGQIFSSEAIANEVNSTFDFNISPLVVEGLVPALVNEGLLESFIAVGSDHALYKCLKETPSERSVDTSGAVQALFDRYREYSRSELNLHSIACSDGEIDASLLDALTASDMLHVSLGRDVSKFRGRTLSLKKEPEAIDPQKTLRQALAYLSATFIQTCINSGASETRVLVQASWGALVSEVVLALQRPNEETKLDNLTIFFDGPVLLDALDLGDELSANYAKDLLILAQRSGARLCTFSHMLVEMQEILRVFLTKIDQNDPVSGPLAERIKRDPGKLLQVRASLPTLLTRLAALKIEVLDEQEFVSNDIECFFTNDQITSLRAWIAQNHFHEHVQRDLRDAMSIGYTLRMRRGIFAPSISSAGAIFVTRNPGLVKAAQRYLTYARMLPEYTPPPCVSDRQLAGVLWFCTGGGGESLTHAKLAANCSIAVTPRTDLVTSMAQLLLDVPNKRGSLKLLLEMIPPLCALSRKR